MSSADSARIIIHIGPHKTGTTFLQTLFSKSREHLRSHGFDYPGERVNHNAEYLLFCDAPHEEHEAIRRGYKQVATAEASVERGLRRFADELRRADGKRILLSAEEFSRLSRAGVRRMLSFLQPFGSLHVLAYARSPLDVMLSDAQEALKGGLTFEDLKGSPPSPNYKQAFGAWLSEVGHSRMTVMPFPSSEKLEVVTASALSLPPFPSGATQGRANVSLSLNAALIVSELNKLLPQFLNGSPNPARGRVPNGWLAEIPGPRFSLPPDVFSEAMRTAADEVVWLNATFGFSYDMTENAPYFDDCQMDKGVVRALALLLNRLALQMNGMVAEGLVRQAAHLPQELGEDLLRRALSISPTCTPALEKLATMEECERRLQDTIAD